MTTQTIWIQRNATGYTLWSEYLPSYEIPNNLGLDEALAYFRDNKEEWEADKWFPGTGTYLGYLESGEKCKVLCKLNDMAELI